MPLFEFTCDKCHADFDELVQLARISSVSCPHCGATKVSRKLSTFAARSGSPQATSLPGAGCGRCGDPTGPCGI